MGKLKQWLRVEPVEKADDDAATMEALSTAAIAAFYAAAAEYDVNTERGFTLSVIADQDGDADGDGQTLFCICAGGYDFYVLADGKTAEVIAYYSYTDMYLCCSEDIAEELTKQEGADTDEERHQAVLRATKPKKQPSAAYKVLKADAAQQYTLGVAYPVDEVDAHGDYTDETELEKAAWDFMRTVIAKGESGVGTDHADGTDGAAEVVESYIYRGPDWEIDGEVVAKAGDWMVGAVWSDEAWASIEKGERVGWSIQGIAEVISEPVDE